MVEARDSTKEERSARATAGAETRRRNEADMSAEEQAALAQKRSDEVFFLPFRKLVAWLEGHNYKCPSMAGKTALERELGTWIYNVRQADNGNGNMVLDHRRRRYLEAINFVWEGVKGRGGTYMRFPDDWEIRMENDSG